MAKLDLQDGPSLLFDEAPNDLNVFRSGSGVRLQIPMQIALRWDGDPNPRPTLSNIRCTISIMDRARQLTELGVATDETVYLSSRGTHPMSGHLQWRLDLGTLSILERVRDGSQPRFQFTTFASAGELIRPPGGKDWREVQTAPRETLGTTEVTYSLEVWNRMLKRAGISQNILLEMPVPGAAPPGWDRVWKLLGEAHAALEQGGSTGWKACVTAAREALSEWQKVEPEDKGPGWQTPPRNDLESRTLKQRMDNVRWHLLQFAHYAPHSHADEWTRADALLVLSTLSALISKRKP